MEDKCCETVVDKQIGSERKAYFFKLSKYEDRLKELFQNDKFCFPAARKNEMVANFLDKGLEDLCVTRTYFRLGYKSSI